MPVKKTKTEETFEYDAALYFLGTQGDYLFKYHKEGQVVNKFIRHTEVAAAFSGQEIDSGWIQPGVLRFGAGIKGNWFVYHEPRQIVNLSFYDTTPRVLKVPIPAMVMIQMGSGTYFFALKSKTVSAGVKLYVAPLPNLNAKGSVCWGTTKLPKLIHHNAGKIWEAFLGSVFTTHTDTGKVKGYPDGCIPFWDMLAAKKARTFPVGRLIPMNLTLGGAINQLERLML